MRDLRSHWLTQSAVLSYDTTTDPVIKEAGLWCTDQGWYW